MKKLQFAASVMWLLAAGTPVLAWADPITFTVDCSKGQTVSDAITRADADKPLTVVIAGTCTESVRITRDNVTLQGDPRVGGTLVGPSSSTDVIPISARAVAILNLTITGGQNGVVALRQSEVVIRGSTIEGAALNGIRASGSAVRINYSPPRPCIVQHSGNSGLTAEMGADVTVNNCQFIANAGPGISAFQNSTLQMNGVEIRDNGSDGLLIMQNSFALLGSTTITGNGADPSKDGNGVNANDGSVSINRGTISDNRQNGILATLSSVGIYGGATITGNEHGVGGYLATSLVLGGGTVSNNRVHGVWCNANCTAQISDASINGNGGDGIMLLWGSKLMLVPGVTSATGNGGVGLRCGDDESSVYDLALLDGTNIGCTGY